MIRKNIALLLGLLMVTALFAEEAMNIDGATGDVTIHKNLIVTGSSDLTGDITVIGNISKVLSTNNTKEILVVGDETVTVNAITEINGTTTITGDFVISSSANETVLNVEETQIIASKKVVVSGGLESDTLLITSTANDSIKTNGRIVAPSLAITGGLTVDNTTITASKPIVVDSESSLDITDVLTTTDSSVTIKQDLTITEDVSITGAENVTITTDTLTVTDALVIDDVDITVNKPLVISAGNSVTIEGDVQVSGKLTNKTVSGTVNTYDAFPVGTIIMFNADEFYDDITIPGWYVCDGDTVGEDNYRTPNLVGQFIKAARTSGDDGNSANDGNTRTLATSNLPSHNHSVSVNDKIAVAAVGSTTSTGAHKHTFKLPTDNQPSGNMHSIQASDREDENLAGDYETNINGEHNHSVSVTVPVHGHTVNQSNVGSSTAFSIEPSYYSLIYIIKAVD